MFKIHGHNTSIAERKRAKAYCGTQRVSVTLSSRQEGYLKVIPGFYPVDARSHLLAQGFVASAGKTLQPTTPAPSRPGHHSTLLLDSGSCWDRTVDTRFILIQKWFFANEILQNECILTVLVLPDLARYAGWFNVQIKQQCEGRGGSFPCRLEPMIRG